MLVIVVMPFVSIVTGVLALAVMGRIGLLQIVGSELGLVLGVVAGALPFFFAYYRLVPLVARGT